MELTRRAGLYLAYRSTNNCKIPVLQLLGAERLLPSLYEPKLLELSGSLLRFIAYAAADRVGDAGMALRVAVAVHARMCVAWVLAGDSNENERTVMKKLTEKTIPLLLAAALVVSSLAAGDAIARSRKKSLVEQAVTAIEDYHSFAVPATGSIEVAFSPDEGSEHLVLKVIDSARSDIQVLSYSFTSARVTEALLRAKKRGVDVKVVADYKNNVSEDRSGKARAALSALVNAGADVRVIRVYPIHHDKVIVVDGETVELGSFNYSDAAAHKNSENVLVNWHNPGLAKVYLQHFLRNYGKASRFQLQY